MAEQRHEGQKPHRYEETDEPKNPPNSVLSRDARKATVWSYFVPVVVLFAVVGIGLLYWSSQPAGSRAPGAERSEIGTVGRTAGGFDPTPRSDSAREELEQRGGDLAPVDSLRDLDNVNASAMAGRRVALTDVEVASVQGAQFWVGGGDDRYEVIAPEGSAPVRTGMHVNIDGRVESDANGGVRIRADRVQPH